MFRVLMYYPYYVITSCDTNTAGLLGDWCGDMCGFLCCCYRLYITHESLEPA
jgi:hypothetical protein